MEIKLPVVARGFLGGNLVIRDSTGRRILQVSVLGPVGSLIAAEVVAALNRGASEAAVTRPVRRPPDFDRDLQSSERARAEAE